MVLQVTIKRTSHIIDDINDTGKTLLGLEMIGMFLIHGVTM